MYGGLDTIISNLSCILENKSDSTKDISASKELAFSFATVSALLLISLAKILTSNSSNSFFNVIPIIPLPVQRSNIFILVRLFFLI